MKAIQDQQARLDRRDNELRAEKKKLSELKGKKRQLEQKISTKQDRYTTLTEHTLTYIHKDKVIVKYHGNVHYKGFFLLDF